MARPQHIELSEGSADGSNFPGVLHGKLDWLPLADEILLHKKIPSMALRIFLDPTQLRCIRSSKNIQSHSIDRPFLFRIQLIKPKLALECYRTSFYSNSPSLSLAVAPASIRSTGVFAVIRNVTFTTFRPL